MIPMVKLGKIRRGMATLLLASGFIVILAGCGTAASQAQTSTSGTATALHHGKKTHPHRIRFHGKVLAVSSTQLSVQNKAKKKLTFSLTSTTKYRVKKAASTLSAVKTGSIVTIVAKHSATGNPIAIVVRLP